MLYVFYAYALSTAVYSAILHSITLHAARRVRTAIRNARNPPSARCCFRNPACAHAQCHVPLHERRNACGGLCREKCAHELEVTCCVHVSCTVSFEQVMLLHQLDCVVAEHDRLSSSCHSA